MLNNNGIDPFLEFEYSRWYIVAIFNFQGQKTDILAL